jgi:hypothetical protein
MFYPISESENINMKERERITVGRGVDESEPVVTTRIFLPLPLHAYLYTKFSYSVIQG